MTKSERLKNENERLEEIIDTMAEQKADMLAIMLKVAGYLIENRKALTRENAPTWLELELQDFLRKYGAEVPLCAS